MPIHHPILDHPDEVKRLLFDENSIALKIHGIASYTSPRDVTKPTIQVLRQTRKPLVVHTDYYLNHQDLTPLQNAYKANNPIQYVRIFVMITS